MAEPLLLPGTDGPVVSSARMSLGQCPAAVGSLTLKAGTANQVCKGFSLCLSFSSVRWLAGMRKHSPCSRYSSTHPQPLGSSFHGFGSSSELRPCLSLLLSHSLSASFPYLPCTSAGERGEHWGFLLPSTCCDDQSQPVGTSGLEPSAHSPLTLDLCPCISSDAQSHFSLATAPQAHSAVADNLHSGSPVLSHSPHPSYHGSYFLCLQRRPTASTGPLSELPCPSLSQWLPCWVLCYF